MDEKKKCTACKKDKEIKDFGNRKQCIECRQRKNNFMKFKREEKKNDPSYCNTCARLILDNPIQNGKKYKTCWLCRISTYESAQKIRLGENICRSCLKQKSPEQFKKNMRTLKTCRDCLDRSK